MSADAKSMWDLMQMFKRKLMPLDLSQSDNARKLKKNLDTILGSWTSVTLVTNAISQSKALEEVLKTFKVETESDVQLIQAISDFLKDNKGAIASALDEQLRSTKIGLAVSAAKKLGAIEDDVEINEELITQIVGSVNTKVGEAISHCDKLKQAYQRKQAKEFNVLYTEEEIKLIDKYPNLSRDLHQNNLNAPLILKVLLDSYSDIFPVLVIEGAYERKELSSDYMTFFLGFIGEIDSGMDEKEVMSAACAYLNSSTLYTERKFFLPTGSGEGQSALGFLEKVDSKKASNAEPLTRIDMLRAARFLNDKYQKGGFNLAVKVLTLSEPAEGVENKKTMFLVNVNEENNKPPKWVSVAKKEGDRNYTIYSESLLSRTEKEKLEKKFPNSRYEGESASAGPSSGYLALAWCNEIKRCNAMTLTSDFNALVEEFCFISECRSLGLSQTHKVRSIYKLARVGLLGEIGDREFPIGNLSEALSTINDINEAERENLIKKQIEFNQYSYVLGLDKAMKLAGLLSDSSNGETTVLSIPQTVSVANISPHYSEIAKVYAVPVDWLGHYKFSNDVDDKIQLARAMLLATVRIAARKPKLQVSLPRGFRLDNKSYTFLKKTLEEQPYIESLDIEGNHQQLEKVKRQVDPTLARNEWLRSQGYLPPLQANYWQEAAKYWLEYAALHLEANENKEAHNTFFDCTRRMGKKGIEELLKYLKDPLKEQILETLFLGKKATLNASVKEEDIEEVLRIIKEHLSVGATFPFANLIIPYGSNITLDKYSDLFDEINKKDYFKEIQIEGFDDAQDSAIEAFLDGLIKRAETAEWTSTILIKHLEKQESSRSTTVVDKYKLINDIILTNRRKKMANTILVEEVEEQESHQEEQLVSQLDKSKFNGALGALNVPISNNQGAELQVQQQQQQQVVLVRQLQIDKKQEKAKVKEQLLPEELITFDNIDFYLLKYCKDKKLDLMFLKKNYASLKEANDTPLQSLFRTWINAKIPTGARHCVSGMTRDAVKVLLEHAEKFCSGLSYDNLPAGFFVQENERKELVLGFNAELGYSSGQPNELTVSLSKEQYKRKDWQGDFRQFNLAKYQEMSQKTSGLTYVGAGLCDMILFDRMQTSLSQEEIDNLSTQFTKKNQGVRDWVNSSRNKKDFIKNNFHVVKQLWGVSGARGIEEFYQLLKYGANLTTPIKNYFKENNELLIEEAGLVNLSGDSLNQPPLSIASFLLQKENPPIKLGELISERDALQKSLDAKRLRQEALQSPQKTMEKIEELNNEILGKKRWLTENPRSRIQILLGQKVPERDRVKSEIDSLENILAELNRQPSTRGALAEQKTLGLEIAALERKTKENSKKIKSAIEILPSSYQKFKHNIVEPLQLLDDLKKNKSEIKARIYGSLFSNEEHRDFFLARFDEGELRALGQLFNEYRQEGVSSFCAKLIKIKEELGEEFFLAFKQLYLTPCEDYSAFVGNDEPLALNEMIEKLKGVDNQNKRDAFLNYSERHLAGVGHGKHLRLWRGFSLFLKEMDELEIRLPEDFLKNLAPSNMLVILDRIGKTACAISDHEERQDFINNVTEKDLTHGGAYYAVVKENFKFTQDDLKLKHFENGTPSYQPDLQTIDQWTNTTFASLAGTNTLGLYFKRSFASMAKLTKPAFLHLSEQYHPPGEKDKEDLILISLCKFDNEKVGEAVAGLRAAYPDKKKTYARHLLATQRGEFCNKSLEVDLSTVVKACRFEGPLPLSSYPLGSVFETLTILDRTNNDEKTQGFISLLEEQWLQDFVPKSLAHELLKCAALFGEVSPQKLKEILCAIKNLKPIAKKEFRALISQLLSIDYEQSNLDNLKHQWALLQTSFETMRKKPANSARAQKECIKALQEKGIHFRQSSSRKLRLLKEEEKSKVQNLSETGSHQDKLWYVICQHIAIPFESAGQSDTDAINSALSPIISFFKQLKYSDSKIDELEPILSSFLTTKKAHCWSADFITELLRTLQPTNPRQPFPLNLFCELLKEDLLNAKPIEEVNLNLPEDVRETLQQINNLENLSNNEKIKLSRICLREFNDGGTVEACNKLITLLSDEKHSLYRAKVLDGVLNKDGKTSYYEVYSKLNSFISLSSPQDEIKNSWSTTLRIWLNHFSEGVVLKAHNQIINTFGTPDKRPALFHIVAYSALLISTVSGEEKKRLLERKLSKLISRLSGFPHEDLEKIAKFYPSSPSPNITTLLKIIKKSKQKDSRGLSELLNEFSKDPHSDIRSEYKQLLSTREYDFKRMLKESKIRSKGCTRALSSKEALSITLAFKHLKSLESGEKTISLKGEKKQVSTLSDVELKDATKELSRQLKDSSNSLTLKIELWAVLFEVLGRVSGKYPHLAQQYALIANEVGIKTDTRALRLSTGEGKSHFVALQAARNALSGKKVEVCTAKNTLAERDLEDYQQVFNALGVKTSNIFADSPREDYTEADVHYTTLGSLSLFLDEQAHQGSPIVLDRNDRFILFDEFDYVFFEEGQNTGYNYASSSPIKPKQMIWFYEAVNEFYKVKCPQAVKQGQQNIDGPLVGSFLEHLEQKAGQDPTRLTYLNGLIKFGSRELTIRLQSAFTAARLKEKGSQFTTQQKEVCYDGVDYPMRENVPLSQSNQPVHGSTYSNGAHQLLATLCNEDVDSLHAPQNFHVHPESEIISAQLAIERTKELASHWAGFSGSVSLSQSYQLSEEFDTEILDVPTNLADRRKWHTEAFHHQEGKTEQEINDLVLSENAEAINEAIDAAQLLRNQEIVAEIRDCLSHNKSILFACQDDLEVVEITKILQENLNEDEQAQLLSYTNDQNRSNKDIMAQKKEMEQWQTGEKGKAVCLIASGFGRGDNVGVEAVFLTSVRDKNDLLQKGGRTARNGAYGEVFQHYNLISLKREFVELLRQKARLEGKEVPNLSEVLREQSTGGSKQDNHKKLFEEVLSLRESVEFLETRETLQCKRLKAQLSSWLMATFAKVKDEDNKKTFEKLAALKLKEVDDLWHRNKILPLKERYTIVLDDLNDWGKRSNDLFDDFFAAEQTVDNFLGHSYQEINAAPPGGFSVNENVALTNIILELCESFAAFDYMDKVNDHFLNRLQALEKRPDLISVFARELKKKTSFNEVSGYLDILCSIVEEEYETYDELNFKTKLPSSYSQEFWDLIEIFALPDFNKHGIKPTILNFLCKESSLIGVDARAKSVMPILGYLKKFKSVPILVNDYLDDLEHLSQENTFREKAYQCLAPMAHRYFLQICKLGERFNFNEQELKGLQAAFSVHPEEVNRVLIQVESWFNQLNVSELDLLVSNKSFFLSVQNVVRLFAEQGEFQLLAKLINQSQEIFSLSDDGIDVNARDKKREVIALWQNLSAGHLNLKNDKVYFEKAFQQAGKSWMYYLQGIFSLPSTSRGNHCEINQQWDDATKQKSKRKVHDSFAKETVDKEVYKGKHISRRMLNYARGFIPRETEKSNLAEQVLQVAINYLESHQTHISFWHTNQLQAAILINAMTKCLQKAEGNFSDEDRKETHKLLQYVLQSLPKEGSLSRDLISLLKDSPGSNNKLSSLNEAKKYLSGQSFLSKETANEKESKSKNQSFLAKALSEVGLNYKSHHPFSQPLRHTNQAKANMLCEVAKLPEEQVHDSALLILKTLKKGVLAKGILDALANHHFKVDYEQLFEGDSKESQTPAAQTFVKTLGANAQYDLGKASDAFLRHNEQQSLTFRAK